MRAIDGDTLIVAGERIRLRDIDAPEIQCRCARECNLAHAARAFAQARLADGRLVMVRDRGGRDRWGRTLARVHIDDVDLGQALIDAGHVRPYNPRLGRQSWC
jgi:micrococcal nuclease